MASVEECQEAVDELVRRLEGYDHDSRRAHIPDRSIALTLLDLDVTFRGRLHDGQLVDITTDPGPKPQVRLTMNSDDLIELTERRLKFTHAWATGRVHLDAGFRDLLRLRKLM